MTFTIDHTKRLTLNDLKTFLFDADVKVVLSEATKKSIQQCRTYLDEKIKRSEQPIYGINTGFGSLCNIIIPDKDIEQLQENLVKSHACGMGQEVPQEIVKLMLLLKIQSVSYGKSGVQLQTVERLCDFINHKIYPVIYQLGSLGASGDLAPLAHLSLPLLGMGKVNHNGKQVDASSVLKEKNLAAIKLKSKEGLALLNGTQFMSAYGCYCLLKSEHLNKAADLITAISLDAFDGRIDPFKDNLHTIRAHAGQLQTARAIRSYLEGSEIGKQIKTQVQDPYSFRCAPQVHGASRDALAYVAATVETECNAVTDNPNIFPEEDLIVSGGNFHGQPLALALDHFALAVAELGSISERRTYQLISGQRGLPTYLVAEPGLNSGLMIPQYTAAGIVSQNKQLCTPASVDSIVSSNGQEDHVSMGANAATKSRRVVENVEQILGIELLTAVQALAFRRPHRSSETLEKVAAAFRETVEVLPRDRVLYPDLHRAAAFVRSYAWA